MCHFLLLPKMHLQDQWYIYFGRILLAYFDGQHVYVVNLFYSTSRNVEGQVNATSGCNVAVRMTNIGPSFDRLVTNVVFKIEIFRIEPSTIAGFVESSSIGQLEKSWFSWKDCVVFDRSARNRVVTRRPKTVPMCYDCDCTHNTCTTDHMDYIGNTCIWRVGQVGNWYHVPLLLLPTNSWIH